MRFLILLVFLSFFNFCNIEKVSISSRGGKTENGKKILLKIGGREITRTDWEEYLKSNTPEEEIGDDILSELFDSFIERELIYTFAIDRGFKINGKEYGDFLRRLGVKDSEENKRTFIVASFLKKEVKDKIVITQEELKKYYHEHFNQFRQKKLYHIKEIVVNNKDLAQEIHGELIKNGVLRFGNFAREYSISPSAINGGDLGYFSRNQLPPEFEKIIFSLKPGKISKVIRTKYGYHIFYLEEVIGEHQLKFYEAKKKIDSILREKKEKIMYNDLLDRLKSRYKIKIFRKNLGFYYSGRFNQ